MTTTIKTNMDIWKKLGRTNPKYTKNFNKFGTELTTIDPMYQLMMMTDLFGPVGEGWSYHVNYTYTDKCVFAEVTIKYCVRKQDSNPWYKYGPVSSVQALYKKNGGLDDEAPKKAMTDAMTKAFSHLGMSADVFLGLFNSNKYIESTKEHFAVIDAERRVSNGKSE